VDQASKTIRPSTMVINGFMSFISARTTLQGYLAMNRNQYKANPHENHNSILFGKS